MNYEKLYTDLGYLYYSIAASDRKVDPEEREALLRDVKGEWMPLESSHDALGTDVARYIDIAFDYAVQGGMSADEAFGRFSSHFSSSPSEFDKGMRRMILTTANKVASARAAKNKSELVRLAQLEELFAKHPVTGS